MDENRNRPMDTNVEETHPDHMEHEDHERMEHTVHDEPRATEGREERTAEHRTPSQITDEGLLPLFEDDTARQFRSRWQVIQGKFVDDPRDSVKQADELVADIIKNVTMSFADRRISLEKHWNSGADISTEDMRIALKRYRSFFERLLTLES